MTSLLHETWLAEARDQTIKTAASKPPPLISTRMIRITNTARVATGLKTGFWLVVVTAGDDLLAGGAEDDAVLELCRVAAFDVAQGGVPSGKNFKTRNG